MNKLKRLLFILAIAGAGNQAYAQFDESGIAAGFFDSSNDKEINFSEFHLPPLAILFENAKANPQILSLEKAREIAQAEVAKQKRHIFSYLNAHGSFSYGIGDSWGTSENAYSPMLMQYQGTKNKAISKMGRRKRATARRNPKVLSCGAWQVHIQIRGALCRRRCRSF